MSANVETIVLLPRFTSLVGEGTLYTKPIQIRRFATANVVLWAGAGIGTSPTLSMVVQTSSDLRSWAANGSTYSPTPPEEIVNAHVFNLDWLRLAITLGGTFPGFSCWSIGEFTLREPR